MVDERALYEHLCKYLTPRRIELFDRVSKLRTRHICLALEDIFQPHNASAVLRSCDCFGIQDVHIIENRNEYELKKDVSLGSAKWLHTQRYNASENNTASCLQTLKAKGYRIVATALDDNTQPVSEVSLEQPIALVFGNELNGISDVVREHADSFAKIEMSGFTESFNISVAAALCLYDLRSRLDRSDINWSLSDEEQLKLKLDWAKRHINHGEEMAQEFIDEQK